MNNLLKQFDYLKDNELGQLLRIIWHYEETGEILKDDGNMANFFKCHIQSKADVLLKKREREKNRRKGAKKNEN